MEGPLGGMTNTIQAGNLERGCRWEGNVQGIGQAVSVTEVCVAIAGTRNHFQDVRNIKPPRSFLQWCANSVSPWPSCRCGGLSAGYKPDLGVCTVADADS